MTPLATAVKLSGMPARSTPSFVFVARKSKSGVARLKPFEGDTAPSPGKKKKARPLSDPALALDLEAAFVAAARRAIKNNKAPSSTKTA